MIDMITYFLNDVEKDYFYEDFGEGKIIFEIPEVTDAYDWEEKQLIPTLEAYGIFDIDSDCDYLEKGNTNMQFIRDVIDTYGSIKFGDVLEIGTIKMKEKEFEELEELW